MLPLARTDHCDRIAALVADIRHLHLQPQQGVVRRRVRSAENIELHKPAPCRRSMAAKQMPLVELVGRSRSNSTWSLDVRP